MIRKARWTTIVAVALLLVCLPMPARSAMRLAEDADEYAVYSVVINREAAKSKAPLAVIYP